MCHTSAVSVGVTEELTKVNSTPSAAACKVTVLTAVVIPGMVTNTPPRVKFVIVTSKVLTVA